MSDAWLGLGLFILLAYTLEAITGFGSTLVALSLGALLLPIHELLPLKLGFGLLILWFALPRSMDWVTRLQTAAAGINHGLFASGGPLALDKARLRATLLCVWFGPNCALSLAFLLDGSLEPALPRVAAHAPPLILAAILGEHLHRQLDEAHFRTALHLLLCICGLLLCYRA